MEMDIMENMIAMHIPTDRDQFYVAEVHMAVGNRINSEPDYWLCKYGTDVKMYLGNALNRADVEKAVRIMEQGSGA